MGVAVVNFVTDWACEEDEDTMRRDLEALMKLAHPLPKAPIEAAESGVFLIARLEEFEQAGFDDEEWFLEYNAHVAPALARFRQALAASHADGDRE